MVGSDQVDRPEAGMSAMRLSMKHDVPFRARVLLPFAALGRHSGTRRRRGPGIHSHSRGLWIPGFLATLGTRNDSGEIDAGRSRFALAAFVVAILLPAAALAQDYPNRPITLIVPYSAGGGNDLMARTAAEKMSKTLGQQIVIENRGGAGGSIATRQIAKSGARRLHARARRHRHARHQSDALRQCRLRPAQGFRADRPDRHQRAGGAA